MSLPRLITAAAAAFLVTTPSFAGSFGFAEFWGAVNATGAAVKGSGITSSSRAGRGFYKINFARSLDTCIWVASQRGTAAGSIASRRPNAAQPRLLEVYTFDASGAAADRDFNVIVSCRG